MSARQSISFRLIVSLAAAQFVAIVFLVPLMEFAISILGLGAASAMSPDEWGEYRLIALVQKSLTRTPDENAIIQPTAALRDYMIANPQARYAVVDPQTKKALPGSSPELVAALAGLDRIDALALKFHLPGDEAKRARGSLRLIETAIGRFVIAVYGYRFAWEDLYEVARLFLTLHTAIVIAPGIFGAVLVGWVVVRHGLAPLRAAAADIAAIDVNTLHRRISSDDAPKEVVPFIDAVNGALTRLDAGVAAQRRFSANAAHELRTPIAIMRAHADNPDNEAFRRDMRRDIHRIQSIVEQLLATARFSVPCEKEVDDLDLGTTVLALIADFTPLVIENKRNIAFEQPRSRIGLRLHKWALECVVTNLLNNALRAEPEGGVIQVRVLEPAVIEVVDHGNGVSPSDRDKIFEPFWRRETSGKGAGLGLAISKELVELMGGALSLEETPGGGATFKISFVKVSGSGPSA
ncbi:HAMP domain-containing sensor histidine kinase [Methylocystis sp. JR02]|uniref:sensor histidine kinase n=1 Tax=Methylocystis sp. JR02 TaxID=3046284 RepID=UPI0024BAA992|nr:HAMP domain-containing sensor histidine kinase [Methylocystis sp. JR02]MDJ0450637.1 HAMP domain-containing sensor histidine kinase [Methylocystis sp. JR02]